VQQGKGADLGASMGGSSSANSVFGAGGAVDFIAKLTTGLAIAFMCTSILLVRAYNVQSPSRIGTAADVTKGSLFTEADEKKTEVDAKAGAVVAAQTPKVAAENSQANKNFAAGTALGTTAPVAPIDSPEQPALSDSPVVAGLAAAVAVPSNDLTTAKDTLVEENKAEVVQADVASQSQQSISTPNSNETTEKSTLTPPGK